MDFDLAALMDDVGPLDDDIEAVTQREDGRWIIRFPPLNVEVETDAQARRIVFSTVLPPAPKDRRTEVYEAVLLYASAWRETGGVRMALGGSDGPIVQIADILTIDATPKAIVTVARNLVTRGVVWTKFLLGGSTAADEAPKPVQAQADTTLFIRI